MEAGDSIDNALFTTSADDWDCEELSTAVMKMFR